MPKTLQEPTLQESLARQLCDSVERLQHEVEKVEFWASAVRGLVAPIPDYQPEDVVIARYIRPGRVARKRRRRMSRARQTKELATKPASA
jgi:hypothetical protein